MHNPRLQSILIEKVQVCADHMRECFRALCVVDKLAEEADIVVAEDIVCSGLVEVFIFCGGV